MITIILPGYSERNRKRAYELKKNIKLNHKIVVHEWKHWESGSFSVKKEIDEILKIAGKQKVNIVAKSVGTRVAMHLVSKILKQINKIILSGIPTKFESEIPKKLYKEGLGLLSPSQIVVYQNEKDPLANYSVVRKFIKSVNPKIEVINKPRTDHNYSYFLEFQEFLIN